jgi:hypothetical protein
MNAVGIGLKAPDLTIEPGKDDRKLEVWLEHRIIKDLCPAYHSHASTLAGLEQDLSYNVAILKACVVGKGRGGKWEKYAGVKEKQFGVTVRTLNRWIEKRIEDTVNPLPEWVLKRLIANKRKNTKTPKVKMSIPLVFDTEKERALIQRAVEKFGLAKLTALILDKVREELELAVPRNPPMTEASAEPGCARAPDVRNISLWPADRTSSQQSDRVVLVSRARWSSLGLAGASAKGASRVFRSGVVKD